MTAGRMSANEHPNAPAHRKIQKEKPLGPHLTSTTSTIVNDMPSVGAGQAPPELISSVDPDFVPKDAVPENTERMTGGTQPGSPESDSYRDLGVGEMEGGKFRIEPIRRIGEDVNTMRARLVCAYISVSIWAVLCLSRSKTRAAKEAHSKVTC